MRDVSRTKHVALLQWSPAREIHTKFLANSEIRSKRIALLSKAEVMIHRSSAWSRSVIYTTLIQPSRHRTLNKNALSNNDWFALMLRL